MGPPLYMRSVVDRNVVMWRMTVIVFITFGVQEAVPLEKLTVPQVTINPPSHCMEPEGSSPYSQQPPTYSEPDSQMNSVHTPFRSVFREEFCYHVVNDCIFRVISFRRIFSATSCVTACMILTGKR